MNTMHSLTRRSRFVGLTISLVLSASVVSALPGQGSRVIITVYQSSRLSTTRAAGATVCFSSTSNTKVADANGVVTFEKVPRGVWSAIGWKRGYSVERTDITVPGTGGDVRASITLPAGTEASPCVAPAPAPAPPPSTALPPAEPGKVTLVVTVYRAPEGTPLEGAYVCVGTDSSHPDSYAQRAYTDANGRVVFHVDPGELTVSRGAMHWYLTARKTNYSGQVADYALNTTDTYGIVQFRLYQGSGGPDCP